MKGLVSTLQDPLIQATISDPSLTELGEDPEGIAVRNAIQGMFPNAPSNRKIFVSKKTGQYLVARFDGTVLILCDADFVRYTLAESRSYHRITVAPSRVTSQEPPRVGKLLLLLIPKKNREHLLGDLEEEYQTVVLPKYGLRAARRWYWWHVCISIGPLIWAKLRRVAGLVLLWKSVR
jgi:hypothetical protein